MPMYGKVRLVQPFFHLTHFDMHFIPLSCLQAFHELQRYPLFNALHSSIDHNWTIITLIPAWVVLLNYQGSISPTFFILCPLLDMLLDDCNRLLLVRQKR
jgi:hypothetical protein